MSWKILRRTVSHTGELETHLIEGKHLPAEDTMRFVCDKTIEFLEKENQIHE